MIDQLISPRRAWTRVLLVGLAMLLIATLLPGAAAEARSGKSGKGNACDNRNNNTYQKLLECMTLKGVREHQKAFQRIADRNDDEFYPGSRAAGTEGYQDSVDYVARKLKKAGYKVTLDPVDFQFVFPAVLEQTSPGQVVYATGTFTGSGDGDVTGPTIGVDVNLEGDRASDSGCEATDFDPAEFTGPADIALVQRGTCDFVVKARNAQAAGAEAVVIFNQGNDPTRMDLIVGTLGDAPDVDIPVVGASFDDGVALIGADEAHVRVLPSETRTDYNVIAEKRGKNHDNVVMAGAHLDSVTEGPGINDNGSGSAALLETALLMRKVKPQNTIRFAWWAAEELGLLGSADYVEGLEPAERDRIALYQNYDMVGSPNYIFMVYDANESTFPAPEGVTIPPGSTEVERLYEQFYTWKGEPYDDTEFSGRSDYEAFILNGIPSGGLFTGAEVPKTEEQAAIWGGEAGAQFDPCYHLACDTYENNNDHALEVNSDLIAFSMLTYAYSTEAVNGVPGKRVPGKPINLPEPAGPEGTFGSGDGGSGPEHGQS